MMRTSNKTMLEYFYPEDVAPMNRLMYSGVVWLRNHIDEHLYGDTDLGVKLYNEYEATGIEDHLLLKYGDCKLLLPDHIEFVLDKDIFKSSFMKYCQANVYGIAKKYEVTYALFNPLWNVDGTETTTYDIQDKTTYDTEDRTSYNSDTNEGGKSTSTHTDTETKSVTNLNTEVKDTSYNIDSTASPYLTGYTTQEFGSENNPPTTKSTTESGNIVDEIERDLTTEHRGHDSLVKTGSDTGLKTGTETHVRSGNIGVTKSTELLEDSIELSRYSFWEELMEGFIKSRCLLSYEEKEW